MAKVIASSGYRVAAAQELTKRIQTYVNGAVKLYDALNALSQIDDLVKTAIHGTPFGKQQHEADQVEIDGKKALENIEANKRDLDLGKWEEELNGAFNVLMHRHNAEASSSREDSQSFIDFSDAMKKLRISLEESAKEAQEMADKLFESRNDLIQGEFSSLLNIYISNSSLAQAHSFALYQGFAKLEPLSKMHLIIIVKRQKFHLLWLKAWRY